ncbi:MoaF-related domain-containing protein [Chryseobacterium sp. R2ACT005]|uniref:MoaF-related domain-containing protein n=1 Tax=Chryseobacterium sp. R2ACT005 TaxID=3416668 RepID=UPI003CE8FAF2
MSFTIIDGGGRIEKGYTETVETKVAELRSNLFLITWKEISGTTINQSINQSIKFKILKRNWFIPI